MGKLVQKLMSMPFIDDLFFYFLFLVLYRHFQQYFSYIMATSFSGGRTWSTQREPPTMGKQLVNLQLRVEFIPFCNLHSRARTHAILVIGLCELLGNPTT